MYQTINTLGGETDDHGNNRKLAGGSVCYPLTRIPVREFFRWVSEKIKERASL